MCNVKRIEDEYPGCLEMNLCSTFKSKQENIDKAHFRVGDITRVLHFCSFQRLFHLFGYTVLCEQQEITVNCFFCKIK